MKWFALLIFLSAAATGVYVLTQGVSLPEKQAKEKIIQDLPPEEDEEEPRADVKVGAVDEVIRPPSEPKIAEKDPKDAKPSDNEPKDRDSRKRKKKGPDATDDDDDEPPTASSGHPQRPAPPPQQTPRPGVPAIAAPPPVEASKTQATPTPNAGGSGLGNTPLMGGVSTPAGTSSAGSKPPSSPASTSRTRSKPSGPAPQTAEKKSPPAEGQILPIKHSPETSQPSKDEPKEKTAEKTTDAANEFAGLLVSPRSASVSGPNDPEKKVIAVYSMKSGFGPQEKLAVEILRNCETPAATTVATACDVTAPEGGPSVAGYLLGAAVSKEDLVPDSKTLDIGTTIVGTYQEAETGRELPLAEVALQIDPGKVPGHYVVRVRGANEKSFLGSFEVTPMPTIAPPTAGGKTVP